jgi:GTPase SAR1 family protein
VFSHLFYLCVCVCVCRYADSIGASFFETSARENTGIEPLFLEICKKLLVLARESGPDAQQNNNTVRVHEGEEPSGGCPC